MKYSDDDDDDDDDDDIGFIYIYIRSWFRVPKGTTWFTERLSDYPLAPEILSINESMLSQAQKDIHT